MASSKGKSRSKGKTSAKKPSARKSAAKSRPTPEEPQRQSVGETAARQLISKRDLEYLANMADEGMNRAGNITSNVGQEISTYAKNKGLDAQAFRITLRLKRMGKRDPIKLRSVLDNLDYYREALGIDDLAATVLPGMEHPAAGRRQRKRKSKDEAQGELDTAPGTPATVHNLDDHRQSEDQSGNETEREQEPEVA